MINWKMRHLDQIIKDCHNVEMELDAYNGRGWRSPGVLMVLVGSMCWSRW